MLSPNSVLQDHGNILLQDLLERKTIAAQLPLYLEDVRPDGCTALLCAVKRGDLMSTQLVATFL